MSSLQERQSNKEENPQTQFSAWPPLYTLCPSSICRKQTWFSMLGVPGRRFLESLATGRDIIAKITISQKKVNIKNLNSLDIQRG